MTRFFDPSCNSWIPISAERTITVGADPLTETVGAPGKSVGTVLREVRSRTGRGARHLVESNGYHLNELNYSRFDAKLEQRIAEVKADLRLELAGLRSELRQEIAGVKVIMSKQRADLITWMFVFWAGTVVPLAGLMFALFNHFRP